MSTPGTPGPAAADTSRARELAEAFRALSEWAHEVARPDYRNEVSALVLGALSPGGAGQSVVTRGLPVFEHVNLQVAIDAWSAEPGRSVTVQGFSMPPHHGEASLQQLMAGDGLPRMRLTAPALDDLPDGPDSTLACLNRALLLVSDARGRYVLLIQGPQRHEPTLSVEVGGLPVAQATQVLADLDRLRRELNVYRGHLLDVTVLPHGGVSLSFATPPGLHREDVVLPDSVLDRAERHALGVARHREALLAARQHLKRGLLLYGPPGTGKTHTVRYLLGEMTGYTRLVLTGRALSGIGAVTDLARDLLPSAIVLEDVDLVAQQRQRGPGSSPVLFDLLDAMDGAAADADLLFLLTTNRADLLEDALAARPGRVDVAVEIGKPDSQARERLLALYGRGVAMELTGADIAAAVRRTEGVTASFLKELIRRSVLEALAGPGGPADGTGPAAVTGDHLRRALDDLLATSQAVTRTLLGAGGAPGPGPRSGQGPARPAVEPDPGPVLP